jgi:hypothetical protein
LWERNSLKYQKLFVDLPVFIIVTIRVGRLWRLILWRGLVKGLMLWIRIQWRMEYEIMTAWKTAFMKEMNRRSEIVILAPVCQDVWSKIASMNLLYNASRWVSSTRMFAEPEPKLNLMRSNTLWVFLETI